MPTTTVKKPTITLSASIERGALADLAGAFSNGYTPKDVNRVCSRISEATGIELCILWDFYDDAGFGGNSDYAVQFNGKLYECDRGPGRLDDFLMTGGRCPASLKVELGAVIETETDNDFNFALKDRLRPDTAA